MFFQPREKKSEIKTRCAFAERGLKGDAVFKGEAQVHCHKARAEGILNRAAFIHNFFRGTRLAASSSTITTMTTLAVTSNVTM